MAPEKFQRFLPNQSLNFKNGLCKTVTVIGGIIKCSLGLKYWLTLKTANAMVIST